MTPTFSGRIQTRIFLILVIGIPWTLIITPVLPAQRGDLGWQSAARELYPVMFTALAVVLVLGIVVWEPIYHVLQQFRWERDWPSMFQLLVVIPEAIVAWFVVREVAPDSAVGVTKVTFAVHVGTSWLLMWLFIEGPIRMFNIRYRFRGGRILGKW